MKPTPRRPRTSAAQPRLGFPRSTTPQSRPALAHRLTTLELCAGAGGQALGLERAGFDHVALIENDPAACNTLRHNRPDWEVLEHDLFVPLDLARFGAIDLLAGGLPCPPFSIAGKQLGEHDARNLFTIGVEYVESLRPRAVMFENVKGLLNPSFAPYRARIEARLGLCGYTVQWRLLNASEYGVSQLRPRLVMLALSADVARHFSWPSPQPDPPPVGALLQDLMAQNGWPGAASWARDAADIAPTVVGGSKKHGGPDLGPTRARFAWSQLGVDGRGLANEAPGPDFQGMPRLTVEMVARVQGFPAAWRFVGGKTAAYRQVGNAFPPPVAEAVGRQLALALLAADGLADVA